MNRFVNADESPALNSRGKSGPTTELRQSRGPHGMNIVILDWSPRTSGTLRGHLSLQLPSGLVLHEVSVHHRGANWWLAAWLAPCSDRPSMPPGTINGPRDHNGAVIQPPSSGGTAPYGWFGWEPGFRGETRVRLFGLKPSGRRLVLNASKPRAGWLQCPEPDHHHHDTGERHHAER